MFVQLHAKASEFIQGRVLCVLMMVSVPARIEKGAVPAASARKETHLMRKRHVGEKVRRRQP